MNVIKQSIGSSMRYLLLINLLFLSACTAKTTLPQITPEHKWIRDHEFQIMAVVEEPSQIEHYKKFGFTSLMVTNLHRDGFPEKMAGYAVKNDLPWHWFYQWRPGTPTSTFIESLKNYKEQYPGLIAVVVGDENDEKVFDELGEVIREARKAVPDLLYYHALYGFDLPKYAHDHALYREYLQKAANVANVDVVHFNQYPFRRQGTAEEFFKNLDIVREEALKANKPYWNWLQAFGWTKGPFDEPSESQAALQAYASLAYGYKGLSYWTYSSNYEPYSRTLIDAEGNITSVGKIVQKLVPDIKLVGNILKNLESTGIYYTSSNTSEKHIPDGVKYLTPNSSVLIQSATVSDAKYGFLIGMFSDDKGNPYILLVNTNHGYGKTSKETLSTISLEFKDTVKSVALFDCEKGQFRPTKLIQNKLNPFELEGGKGYLYRINLKN